MLSSNQKHKKGEKPLRRAWGVRPASALSGGGGAVWGNITGTLTDQTDLLTALNLKLNSASYTAADVLVKLLTVDGAGTNLDADLLDGQHGVHYLARANHTGTQDWSTITGEPTTLVGYGITDAQPLNSNLTTIAGLTATTDNFIVSVSSAWASRTPAQVRTTLGISQTGADTSYAFRANNLSDLANPAAARTNLGLGTAATQNTGTSGATIPLLNAANTFSATQTFSGLIVSSVTAGGINVQVTSTSGNVIDTDTYDFTVGSYNDVWLYDINTAAQCKFLTDGFNVFIYFQTGTQFSTTAGAAGKVSIYFSGGAVRLENQTGSTCNFVIRRIGGHQ